MSETNGDEPPVEPIVTVIQEEKRLPKMTKVGLLYSIDMKMKRLKQVSKALEKCLTKVLDLLDNDESEGTVLSEYKRWMELYDSFLDYHEHYIYLVKQGDTPEREVDEYIGTWFTPRNLTMMDFKETCENWFQKKAHKRLQEDSDESVDSQPISQVSRHSRTSKLSATSSTRRRLALEIKAEHLQKRQELAKRKLQLQQKQLDIEHEEEEVKLHEELSILEATSGTNDDASVVSRKSISRRATLSLKLPPEDSPGANVISYNATPRAIPDLSTDVTAGNGHVEAGIDTTHISKVSMSMPPVTYTPSHDHMVTSLINHLSRPSTTLDKFSGDPLTYHRFMRQFRCKVVSKTDNEEDRLHFLEQYTSGEAKRIVVGFSYCPDGYQLALKELDRRYGNPEILVKSFITKALTWPQIKPDDCKELDNYALFLSECKNAITSLDALKVIEYTDNFKIMVEKLPYSLQDRWRDTVYGVREQQQHVKFSHLVDFIWKEAQKANDPMFGRNELKKRTDKTFSQTPPNQIRSAPRGTFVTIVKPSAFTSPCCHCQGSHALESCPVVYAMSFYERTDILKHKGFCYGCLKRGHNRAECKYKATCSHCRGRHPSLLHVDGRIPPISNRQQDANPINNGPEPTCITSSVVHGHHVGAGEGEVTMAVVPVQVGMVGSTQMVHTYAFLDPGSNASFISDNLVQQLGLQGTKMTLSMDTMGVKHTMLTHAIKNVAVCDISSTNAIRLPVLYSKDRIPVYNHQIPSNEDIAAWPHLEGVILPQVTADVGLLLGNNVPDAYSPLDVKVGPSNSPHASCTRLGWIVWNLIRQEGSSSISMNSADAQAVELAEEFRNLDVTYQKSVAINFQERGQGLEKHEHSPEDKRCLRKIVKTTYQTTDHRFEASSYPDVTSYALQETISDNTYLEDSTIHPTDIASRGTTPSTDDFMKRWITRPQFLCQHRDDWPDQPVSTNGCFQKELSELHRSQSVIPVRCLHKNDPILDGCVIKAGGRLQRG